jgi:hypothetical protein
MTERGRASVRWVSLAVMGAIALLGHAAHTQPLKQAQPLKVNPPQAAPTAKAEPELPPQTVLMPGLYLFQTRTRDGSCNDAQRTGYVTSAVATLDGVPGSRSMTMQLLSSKYWPTWTLTVAADGTISGTANMGGAKDDANGSSKFEIRTKKDRFQGVGSRSYPSTVDGKPFRCTLNYDALLKLLD